jgi:hypothetical protein
VTEVIIEETVDAITMMTKERMCRGSSARTGPMNVAAMDV